jgi:hypothetical protein
LIQEPRIHYFCSLIRPPFFILSLKSPEDRLTHKDIIVNTNKNDILINSIRNREIPITKLTIDAGLREKVEELLNKEKIH